MAESKPARDARAGWQWVWPGLLAKVDAGTAVVVKLTIAATELAERWSMRTV